MEVAQTIVMAVAIFVPLTVNAASKLVHVLVWAVAAEHLVGIQEWAFQGGEEKVVAEVVPLVDVCLHCFAMN